MEDLATRLRQAVVAKEIYAPQRSEMMLEAATEIERLRGALQDVYGEMAESGADFSEGTPANVAAALNLTK